MENFLDLFKVHDIIYWFVLLISLMYLVFSYLYKFLLPTKNRRTLRVLLLIITWLIGGIVIYSTNRAFLVILKLIFIRVSVLPILGRVMATLWTFSSMFLGI